MKGLDWAFLYDRFGSETLNTEALGKRISELMRDSEIQRQTGIIPYVLTGDEHYLDLRAFPEDIKLAVWEKQNHICPDCGKEFDFEFMEGSLRTARCCVKSVIEEKARNKPKII